MTAREALLRAFDRLFETAASKLQVGCNAGEKDEAKRDFTERFSPALDAIDQIRIPEIPEEVMRSMEEALHQLSTAQLVGHLAAIPLAQQTQAILRTVAGRAAEQRVLEHLINHADDTYGGN